MITKSPQPNLDYFKPGELYVLHKKTYFFSKTSRRLRTISEKSILLYLYSEHSKYKTHPWSVEITEHYDLFFLYNNEIIGRDLTSFEFSVISKYKSDQ